jgi:hypothetical protein
MSTKQVYDPLETEEAVPVVNGEEATVAAVKVVPMIEIVAPATLSEGYAFDCQIGDRVFTVTVVSVQLQMLIAGVRLFCVLESVLTVLSISV